MNEERYNDLDKKVQYLNDEGFAGEGKQFMLFENSDAAIEAIRQNKVSGITWTQDCEKKWQEQNHLEQCYNNDRTEEDDLNE